MSALTHGPAEIMGSLDQGLEHLLGLNLSDRSPRESLGLGEATPLWGPGSLAEPLVHFQLCPPGGVSPCGTGSWHQIWGQPDQRGYCLSVSALPQTHPEATHTHKHTPPAIPWEAPPQGAEAGKAEVLGGRGRECPSVLKASG